MLLLDASFNDDVWSKKKVFMGKATSNIHKIDENFGMLQKKKEHDEHIFLLMLELFEAGNDAQCTFTQNEGKLF